MPNIVKVNSKKGFVEFNKDDLSELDLYRWLRSGGSISDGKDFIDEVPFERVAAKIFVEKYPSDSIKVGKSIYNDSSDTVTTYLSLTDDLSRDLYNVNENKLVFSKEPKSSVNTPDVTDAIPKIAHTEDSDTYYSVVVIKDASEDVLNQDEESLYKMLLHKDSSAKDGGNDIEMYNGIPWEVDARVASFSTDDGTFYVVRDQEQKKVALFFKESLTMQEQKEKDQMASPPVNVEQKGY